MIRSLIITAVFSLLATNCAKDNSDYPEFEGYKVVQRQRGYDEMPEWAKKRGMYAEGNKVYFVDSISISGDSRPEACLDAASLRGKKKMMAYIKSNLTTSEQLDEAGLAEDPIYESLTAFLAQGQLSGVSEDASYYEYYSKSSTTGARELKLGCYTKLKINKSTLEKQLKNALNPKKKGNPKVRKQLLDKQNEFIDNL